MFKQHQKSYYLFILIISILITYQTSSQILAIDFGTQYIKAAIVHSGAGKSFQIVQNHKSQRKFYNALGFYNQQRHYQVNALSKRSKFPKNCFIFSRFLVDFMQNPNQLQTVKKDLFLQYIKEDQDNQLNSIFQLQGFPPQTDEVTFMDIFSMIIKHVKLATQKMAKTQIRDVVIVVPVHWNLKMRQFIISAAEVADLYVLSLISQNTAASINYALSQRSTNKTQTVMFYNLGSNSLQMSLVQYKLVSLQKSAKPVQSIFVLGDYGKSYLGGLRFNSALQKYFAEKFQQKFKKQLSQRGRIKLIGELSKVKETLSANKEATVFVEGIMDGIDFSQTITRKKFQELCLPLFEQVTAPIRRFLLQNDMKPSDIKTVQLIGGSVRIPKLQSLIGEIIGKQAEIGTHINGDQAMALGAAFYAANSSKKFKVKGVHLYDGFNFEVRLVAKNLDQSITQNSQQYFYKNVTVFKKKARFGTNKQVTFKCKQNIFVQIYKQDQNGIELIRRVELPKITQINQTDYKISFTLSIDPVNIVTIKDTKYVYKRQETSTYLQKVKKQKNDTNKSQDQKKQQPQQQIQQEEEQQIKKDVQQNVQTQQIQQNNDEKPGSQSQQQLNNEEKPAEDKNQNQNTQQEKQDQNTQKDQTDQSQKKQQKKDKKKKKKKQLNEDQYQTVQRNKTVTKKYEKDLIYQQTFGYAQTDFQLKQKSKKLLKMYQEVQENWRKLAQSKNKLQAAIYQVRDKMENQEFLEFVQTEQKQKLEKQATQQAQWLDDTVSNDISQYKTHFENLNKILSKIKKRALQFHERDQVKKRALQQISQYKNLTEKLQKQKSWITDQQVEELRSSIKQSISLIQSMYKQMNQKSKNEDLAYKNKDFLKAAQSIKDKYFVVKSTQKPKQQKKKVQKQKQAKKEQEQQDSDL